MLIEKIRLSKNMTQDQLANNLGVSRSTVAMWESGKASPTASKLPIIARVLGCSIEDLFESA